MGSEIRVGNITIGRKSKPFIIAEMSGNHNQSLDRALKIVAAAAAAGAHAIKLQTYTADTMTLKLDTGEFKINNPKSLWNGRTLYDLYQEAYTPWEWHAPLFNRAKELGMLYLSTPFDETSVDFLESLNVPFYKIASFEIIDLPLIKKVAQTKKPIIISTGMASISEIEDAVKTCRENGCNDIVLLKCTSSYPATPENSNILTIPHMRELFNVEVGLSDHTLGIGVATASVAFGATLIEKHFTLSREDGGVDSAFSMEPHELKSLVEETQRAWQATGSIQYGANEEDKNSLVFRRSIYITEDVKKGDVLTSKNLRRIRPGLGLPPKHFDYLLGKKVNQDIQKGTPMRLNYILNG